MRIDIIAPGRIKEKYLRDAIDEYAKRLSRFCTLTVIEVADEKTPEKASQAEEERIKRAEGERILRHVRPDAHVVALAIEGDMMTSVEFAHRLENLTVHGTSHVQFVIGGSLGLSPEVLARADAKLSFSEMTFPHQLMRVILLEQIYRAFTITAGLPYHK